MKSARAGFAIWLLGAGALLAHGSGQPPGALQPPTTRLTDCTTGGCHTAQSSRKFLHGPNAVQACDACHEHLDPAKHAFALKRQGKALCEFCHIDKTGTEGPVVHKPVADGQCLGCHDPHGANNRRMLKKDSTVELCTACHKDVLSASHSHKPAAEDCAKCHSPHTAAHEKLLTLDRRALCLSCHAEVGQTIAGAKHPHDPAAKGDCLQCHRAHGSNEIKDLKASPLNLCASCHQKTVDAASKCVRQHGAVTDARACLNCHTPHGSDHVRQLTGDPAASCMACHSKPIVVNKGRTVGAVPELAAGGLPHKHGPIEKGDCAGCHTVHGGDQDHLLVGNFTPAFYQTYSDNAYQLCLKCHDKGLILAQPADSQTRFRDGGRNLHTVHVAPAGQGRSCRACHSIHASKSPSLISESVQFGQWKLPINFKQTETGGTCAPGCHRPETYDRFKPGGPPTPPTTGKPGAPVPPPRVGPSNTPATKPPG